MTIQKILLGTVSNDGTGSPGRIGGQIINDNFQELANSAQFKTYGGTANAVTLSGGTPVTALVNGAQFRFVATAANTGATTLNIDGLGDKTCKTITGAALPSGYIVSGAQTIATYFSSGDYFQIAQSPTKIDALTAATLATARTIGGVSFDGSANIDLPGVNTAGNQSTTGNAATATKLATARTINGVSFDGSANITIPSTAPTSAQVGAATAGLSAGIVGSYAFLGTETSSEYLFGSTLAGSSLRPTSVRGSTITGYSAAYLSAGEGTGLSGTWMCLGYCDTATTNSTVWLRIS